MSKKQSFSASSMLHARGLKATPRRVALLEVLQSAREPLSIKDITEQLAPLVLDTVTVYRALDALIAASLVRPVDLRHGHTDYEFMPDGEHHHHLVCMRCEKTEDVAYCPTPEVGMSILKASKNFAVLQDHSFEFFGLCKKCV